MILSPEHPLTELVSRVRPGDACITARLDKANEKFCAVVKKFGLDWNADDRKWRRALEVAMNGSPADRATELAAALVNAGFAVDVPDEIGDLVQRAAWEPEHKRWVRSGNNKFYLRWRGVDDNLYARAQTLPDAHWNSSEKAVEIPALYFSEVQGFAEEHDFRFTLAALGLLEESRQHYRRTILPEAPAPKQEKREKKASVAYTLSAFADLPTRHLALKTSLLPHQIPAVEKVLPLKVGALFMDMGTGKTRCAIELAARRQSRVSRVIWFCPVSLKLTIAAEIAKHADGEPVCVFDESSAPDNLPAAFWYVVGIESMSASDRAVLAVEHLIDADTFVIVDESTYIKGHASKRTMRITELSKRARYRLLLTGTPLTQGVEDLYAQMRFLSPDILGYGSFYSFANNHLEYSANYPGMVVRGLQTDRLAEKIAPFVYQVTKAECLNLPEKLYDALYFGLSKEQEAAYWQAKEEILMSVEPDKLDSWVIFKLFTALQQIVSGFWHRDNEWLFFSHERINTLKAAIDGIPESEKVIIWCKYTESVRQIADALPGCALYYGDLSELDRDSQLTRFRADGSRFLVATQATGGHGLTLNEAHYHVFYENEFKYAHRIQAEDRSHRIGQVNPVTYIDIVSHSGIDTRIQRALEKKEDVVKAFRQEVKKEGNCSMI